VSLNGVNSIKHTSRFTLREWCCSWLWTLSFYDGIALGFLNVWLEMELSGLKLNSSRIIDVKEHAVPTGHVAGWSSVPLWTNMQWQSPAQYGIQRRFFSHPPRRLVNMLTRLRHTLFVPAIQSHPFVTHLHRLSNTLLYTYHNIIISLTSVDCLHIWYSGTRRHRFTVY
jgi:hypothetical protein